jgi:hypothetical protein
MGGDFGTVAQIKYGRRLKSESNRVALNASSEVLSGTFVPSGTCYQNGESSMQAAIERVMQTYGMIRTLSEDQEAKIREKVTSFLGKQADIATKRTQFDYFGLEVFA